MSEAKFTPGPWEVAEMEAATAGINITTANSSWKYYVAEAISGMDRETQEANAHLIAAAPELYDAADNALNALIGCCIPAGGVDDRKTILEAQAMLRAAIAKATGASQ